MRVQIFLVTLSHRASAVSTSGECLSDVPPIFHDGKENLFCQRFTSSSRPIGCKGKAQRVEVFQPAVFLLGFGRNCLLIDLETV